MPDPSASSLSQIPETVESEAPEKLADGFRFTEGPVWLPEGRLAFSDIPADKQYVWRPDGTCEVFREPSGNSNGLTLDRQGRLIACEHGNRRLARYAVVEGERFPDRG